VKRENPWERTGTAFPVRIEIKNPDERLLPGMSVDGLKLSPGK